MHLKRLSFHDAMMVCVGSWDKFVLIIWQGHLCTLNCLALTKLTKNGLYVPSLSCLASSLQKKIQHLLLLSGDAGFILPR